MRSVLSPEIHVIFATARPPEMRHPSATSYQRTEGDLEEEKTSFSSSSLLPSEIELSSKETDIHAHINICCEEERKGYGNE